MIGIGIIIPVLPTLITELSGEGLSKASQIGGWLMGAYALMQFFCAPALGALSDRHGRRPIILIALFGLGIDYVFHAWAPTLIWLFVGRILAGISGASFTVATAYIADISAPEKKAQNFGLVGAAFGLGFILGPVIGGLTAEYGVRVPFLVAAGLSLLNFLYGLFILPESLKQENRIKSIDWKKANPFSAFKNFKAFPALLGFMVPFFLIYIAGHSVQSTWTFYTMYRFEWDEAMVGYSLALVGIVVAIVQGGLVKVVVRALGEQLTVIIGMALWSLGLILFASANKEWMMFAYILPYCLGGVAGPTMQGIMSNIVPENMQGQLQGILTSIMSLTSILGPPLMTYIFYLFSGDKALFDFPGAPFALGALMMVAALFMTIRPLNKAISKS
ncbi:MAG: TCR/Tet family MFS transporter [Flavobacteriales bacterium]|nr:TCR/Tet family MFS transporter [Flavobacteriales bacterium]